MSFYLTFIAVNAAIGLFLGLNAWAAFGQTIHNKLLFWLIVLVTTQIYWVCRVVTRVYNIETPALLYFTASSLFALCIVALFIVLGVDIVLLLTRLVKPFNPVYFFVKTHSVWVGIAVAALVLLYYTVGIFIANNPKETHYKITVDKPLGVESVRIVMISDLHITTFTRVKAIKNLVDKINKLDADLVLLGGDIIDLGMRSYLEKDLSTYFSQIKSSYGAYMVMGNHEYYGGDAKTVVEEFTSAGIQVLRDERIFFEQLGITLIGRDDFLSPTFNGHPRAKLIELLDGADMTRPIVVLDHQPRFHVVRDAAARGVDLQLSGHTHNGQFFPLNLIVKRIYINPWGLWTDGAYHLIVSCGIGTWGPPVRTASRSEIVVVDLRVKI